MDKYTTMVSPRLFLTPVAREEANKHFKYTVLNSNKPIWGISEGVKSQWEKAQEGDVLLFYTGDFEYTYGSNVKKTEISRQYANEIYEEYKGDTGIKETRGGGGPWPYLIYLSDAFEIEISSKELHRYADHGIDYPMKFMALNDGGHRKIRSQFGGVAEYLNERRIY